MLLDKEVTMDLINEINRNDKNKNAIKLAKENINAEIISGVQLLIP